MGGHFNSQSEGILFVSPESLDALYVDDLDIVILKSEEDIFTLEKYPNAKRKIQVSTLNGGYDWATVIFSEDKVILFEH